MTVHVINSEMAYTVILNKFQYRKRYDSARNRKNIMKTQTIANVFQYRKRYDSARNPGVQ